jgi:hypothetical protein
MQFATQTFNKLKLSQPYWSTWSCFCETIKGKKYRRKLIKDKLIELVDKSDYQGNSMEGLLDYLQEL